jgi:Fe-S-cluster-containing dehydrogenase component
MTKCTLCVDRIEDTTLAPADRKPACVKACPTGARIFGDVHDPESDASRAIRERGGYALMPEWNTRPANHYLPRRVTASVGAAAREARELGKAADGAARDEPSAP